MGLRQVVKEALPGRFRLLCATRQKELQRAGLRPGSRWAPRPAGLAFSEKRPAKTSLEFAMLCIRRPVYVDLAVASVNSLHYHNSAHHIRVYLDSTCMTAYEKLQKKLDYPRQVTPVTIVFDQATPWQFKKLDVVMDAFSQGIAFVDADSRWRPIAQALLDPDSQH